MSPHIPIPSVRPIRRTTTVKRLCRAREFTTKDVRKRLSSTSKLTDKETIEVFKYARLRLLTTNPYRTVRRYQEIMEACLEHNNGDAHYVEGIKQYFGFSNHQKGLKHLKNSAHNNCPKGIYLYAILLLSTGEHNEGMRYMDSLEWMNDLTKLNTCWKQVKRSLRGVPILKRDEYGTNMMLIMPPTRCDLQALDKPCKICFYYKQIAKFLNYIEAK